MTYAQLITLTIITFVGMTGCSKNNPKNNPDKAKHTNAQILAVEGMEVKDYRMGHYYAPTTGGVAYCTDDGYGYTHMSIKHMDVINQKLHVAHLNMGSNYYITNMRSDNGDIIVYGNSSDYVGNFQIMCFDNELNFKWKKDYGLQVINDKSYTPYVSNAAAGKRILMSMYNLTIIHADNGAIIKSVKFGTEVYYTSVIALNDGFIAFGRQGSNLKYTKYDWDGNILFNKYARHDIYGALLNVTNPILLPGNRILINCYTNYSAFGDEGAFAMTLGPNGNKVDAWAAWVHFDDNTRADGSLLQYEVSPGVYLSATSVYFDESGHILKDKLFHPHRNIYPITPDRYLCFQGSNAPYVADYYGFILFNPNDIGSTIKNINVRSIEPAPHLIIDYKIEDQPLFVTYETITASELNLSISDHKAYNVTTKNITFNNALKAQ